MSKNNMNIKYKSKKRERNNKKVEVKEVNETKSIIVTIVSVVGFIALIYLGALGLEKLGVFEAGYQKPNPASDINYKNILIGETFNRPESEYLVLFDSESNMKNDVYVKYLTEAYTKLNVYYVDMAIEPNSNYASEDSNSKATNVNELKIDGVTLIRVKNKRIAQYITGSDDIIDYLK